MSTKHTIKYSEDFHFYQECFDDDNVYLEVSGNSVIIPIEIWESIKSSYCPYLSLVNKTDEELAEMVTVQVMERLDYYNKQPNALWNIVGGLVFGLASDPVEDQLKAGMEFYTNKRAAQQALKQRIDSIELY